MFVVVVVYVFVVVPVIMFGVVVSVFVFVVVVVPPDVLASSKNLKRLAPVVPDVVSEFVVL